MNNAEAQTKWRLKNPERARWLVRRSHSKRRFGGNREAVLKRDNYSCQDCGMTDEEHRQKWNRQITIDHIDNRGRYSIVKNNSLNNLRTLCLSCHGRKDVMVRHERSK